MENDHLEDALLFLRAVIENHDEFGRFSRWEIERAIEEIEAERRKTAASTDTL